MPILYTYNQSVKFHFAPYFTFNVICICPRIKKWDVPWLWFWSMGLMLIICIPIWLRPEPNKELDCIYTIWVCLNAIILTSLCEEAGTWHYKKRLLPMQWCLLSYRQKMNTLYAWLNVTGQGDMINSKSALILSRAMNVT